MKLPSAIIFINSDLNDITIESLTTQFQISEKMDFSEYNARVEADPNYPHIVHNMKSRILVILPTLQDLTNRDTADLVLFYTKGQVVVEKNKFGPPGLSLPLSRINVFDILRYVKSPNVAPAAHDARPGNKKIRGIFAIESNDTSGVHEPNPDNLMNNEAFVNRK